MSTATAKTKKFLIGFLKDFNGQCDLVWNRERAQFPVRAKTSFAAEKHPAKRCKNSAPNTGAYYCAAIHRQPAREPGYSLKLRCLNLRHTDYRFAVRQGQGAQNFLEATFDHPM